MTVHLHCQNQIAHLRTRDSWLASLSMHFPIHFERRVHEYPVTLTYMQKYLSLIPRPAPSTQTSLPGLHLLLKPRSQPCTFLVPSPAPSSQTSFPGLHLLAKTALAWGRRPAVSTVNMTATKNNYKQPHSQTANTHSGLRTRLNYKCLSVCGQYYCCMV